MIRFTRPTKDDRDLQVLRALPELDSVDERALRGLVAQFDHASVPAGARLATSGRRAAELYVVLEGRLVTEGACGRAEVGPGAAVGWRTLAADAAWPCSVTAADRTELLVMSRAQFRAVSGLRSRPGGAGGSRDRGRRTASVRAARG